MAEATIASFSATADGTGYIDPDRCIRCQEGLTDETTMMKEDLAHQAIAFSSVTDSETYTSYIPNIVATAWQDAAAASGDGVSCAVTTQATGVVTFYCEAGGDHAGWLHMWRRK